ncbi:MAG: capsule biosynthesis protein [Granulosicoccus sp.]
MIQKSDRTAKRRKRHTKANALLLQGPVGPFFSRIGKDLDSRGFTVFKINFNGGDRLFYRNQGAFDYTGNVQNWGVYLERFIQNKGITRVYLFGDCRIYHRIAKQVAARLNVRVFVFEEGYIRPNFITLEEGGVNGHSSMMRTAIQYEDSSESTAEATIRNHGFAISATFSMVYYLACAWHRRLFSEYKHHRPLGWLQEGGLWIRSTLRKLLYRRRDNRIYQELLSQFDGSYFLCPLQVHCDMQVLVHSKFNSIEHFVGEVLQSFVENAPPDTAIVFKHHPLDRGYTDYSLLLNNLICELGLDGRVFYVHDVCLPSLLRNACGSVMINSTVGMSSLFHGTPVKVLGDAIYDRPELTCQLSLDQFWSSPGEVDKQAFERFRSFLIANNQLNGSLYLKLHDSGHSGVCWSDKLKQQHSAEADIVGKLGKLPKLRLVAGVDVIGAAPSVEADQAGPRKAA